MRHCTQSPWLTSFKARYYQALAVGSFYYSDIYICEYLLMFLSSHTSHTYIYNQPKVEKIDEQKKPLLKVSIKISTNPLAYLKPSLTSIMELFAKIFNGSQLLSIFAKCSTKDVLLSSKCTSGICLKSISKTSSNQ